MTNTPRRYKTREGKIGTTIYLMPDEHISLKILAARKQTTLNDLILDACRKLIASYKDKK